MKTEPTAEQLAKLPQWAQQHIKDIARQREESVRTLNKTLDNQTPAKMFCDDFASTGEAPGPTTKRRYFQGHRFTIEHAGIRCDILLSEKNDPTREYGITISYSELGRESRNVALIPRGWQAVELVAKENIRP